jgi:hypothetical protein
VAVEKAAWAGDCDKVEVEKEEMALAVVALLSVGVAFSGS